MAVFNFCYDLATSLLVFLLFSLKLLSLDYLGVFNFLLQRPCVFSIDDLSKLLRVLMSRERRSSRWATCISIFFSFFFLFDFFLSFLSVCLTDR